jgi:CheY-like chemotaxis protein
MRQIVETILRGYGARMITTRETAAEALHDLRKRPFDIVFTEYLMPDMDGAELVHTLRRTDCQNRYVPVILMTSFTSRSRVERARDSGVTEVCAKPVAPRELFRKLASVVDNPRPFIQSAGYVGPDRRRRRDAAYAGDERRASEAVPGEARVAALTR